jgi:molybdate transport system substrate-binding protein
VSPIQLIRRLSASLRCKAVPPVVAAIAIATSCAAHAANTNVAVAANFTEPAKEIAQLFEGKTGH